LKVCKSCLLGHDVPRVRVNVETGVCDFCETFEKGLKKNLWLLNDQQYWDNVEKNVRKRGGIHPVIGVSGGFDSTLLVYCIKKYTSLEPILVHVDAGWNSAVASRNLSRLVKYTEYRFETVIPDWDTLRDAYRKVLLSNLIQVDYIQDSVFFSRLYEFCECNKLPVVLTGANTMTEWVREPIEYGSFPGVDPRGLSKVIGSDVVKKLRLRNVLEYKILMRLKRDLSVFRPIFNTEFKIDYWARELNKEFGFVSPERKHFESRLTRWLEGYWLPVQFGVNRYRAHVSSLIISGQIDRTSGEALLKQYFEEIPDIGRDTLYILDKMEIEEQELESLKLKSHLSILDVGVQSKTLHYLGHVLSFLGNGRKYS
jgi:hypothetical protein